MADLVTTISDIVTLNGQSRGSTNSTTQSGITDVYERIVLCAHSNTTTVAVFDASPHASAGNVTIDRDRTKYIRVTNLSETENIEVAFVGTATLYQVKIRPGYSHVLSEGEEILLAEGDTSPSFGTMESLASIQVQPVGSTDTQIEVFVALV
tara:strand:- start:3365 stop:3820 length:456 start_codon:yes stop_codon:yes gene_type:complete